MNLVEEVKVTYRLNDRELCELEAGIERMELERQMSHDTLELLMEKVSLLCFSTFQKCSRKNRMSVIHHICSALMQSNKAVRPESQVAPAA
jgi:hypothetical protein